MGALLLHPNLVLHLLGVRLLPYLHLLGVRPLGRLPLVGLVAHPVLPGKGLSPEDILLVLHPLVVLRWEAYLLVLHPSQVLHPLAAYPLVLHPLAVRLLHPLVLHPLVGLAVRPERPGMGLCREGKLSGLVHPKVLHPLVLHPLAVVVLLLGVRHLGRLPLLVVVGLPLLHHLRVQDVALRPLRLPVP